MFKLITNFKVDTSRGKGRILEVTHNLNSLGSMGRMKGVKVRFWFTPWGLSRVCTIKLHISRSTHSADKGGAERILITEDT